MVSNHSLQITVGLLVCARVLVLVFSVSKQEFLFQTIRTFGARSPTKFPASDVLGRWHGTAGADRSVSIGFVRRIFTRTFVCGFGVLDAKQRMVASARPLVLPRCWLPFVWHDQRIDLVGFVSHSFIS